MEWLLSSFYNYAAVFTLRTVVLNQGNFDHKDIWQCLNTYLVVTTEEWVGSITSM